MIVVGQTADGCQIMKTHGGTVTEPVAVRDARLELEKQRQLEDAAPDMLAALKAILPDAELLVKACTENAPARKLALTHIAQARAAIAKATNA